jgi:hypothetical protein
LKLKSVIFCPIEAFFELHSIATERKKKKKKQDRALRNSKWTVFVNGPGGAWTKKGRFFSQLEKV